MQKMNTSSNLPQLDLNLQLSNRILHPPSHPDPTHTLAEALCTWSFGGFHSFNRISVHDGVPVNQEKTHQAKG